MDSDGYYYRPLRHAFVENVAGAVFLYNLHMRFILDSIVESWRYRLKDIEQLLFKE